MYLIEFVIKLLLLMKWFTTIYDVNYTYKYYNNEKSVPNITFNFTNNYFYCIVLAKLRINII